MIAQYFMYLFISVLNVRNLQTILSLLWYICSSILQHSKKMSQFQWAIAHPTLQSSFYVECILQYIGTAQFFFSMEISKYLATIFLQKISNQVENYSENISSYEIQSPYLKLRILFANFIICFDLVKGSLAKMQ